MENQLPKVGDLVKSPNHDTQYNETLKVDSNPYCIPYRLHDVIRLITVMAACEKSFMNDEGLDSELRDWPRSAETWLLLAYNHPEFFRMSWDQKRFILLQRYIREPKAEDTMRTKLTEKQTNKLIDRAHLLYYKAWALKQRHAFLYPFWSGIIAAVVAAIAGICIAIFNSDTKSLQLQIDKLTLRIYSIEHTKTR